VRFIWLAPPRATELGWPGLACVVFGLAIVAVLLGLCNRAGADVPRTVDRDFPAETGTRTVSLGSLCVVRLPPADALTCGILIACS